MKKIISVIIICLIVLIVFSVSGNAETGEVEFNIVDTEIELGLNEKKWLFYETSNTYDKEIIWTTSNPDVVTVDEEGCLEGVGIGTATITATVGEKSDSCEVTTVYTLLRAWGNNESSDTINFILGEHTSEKINIKVEDGMYEDVENPIVAFASSNPSVATVDSTGLVTAHAVGTSTVTISGAGVSGELKINVFAQPQFTDFSNAKYELLFDTSTSIKISDIILNKEELTSYYYIITSNNVKPEVVIDALGTVDNQEDDNIEFLILNKDENYMYDYEVDKYVEKNQDLYLWVLETQKLQATYWNEEGKSISYSTKYVVEGEKLTRPELPKLNGILDFFAMDELVDETTGNSKFTHIFFRFPTSTKERKFTLKIGKITDKAILQKIKNNDYAGITELLEYAKNNKAICEKELTTTEEGVCRIQDVLFDGKTLLGHKEYYYIYAKFDDEEGKYYPIEGVTLGQAWHYNDGNSWDLWAYNDEKFEWTDLSSGTTPKPDDTKSPMPLPQTGLQTIFGAIAIVLMGIIVFLKSKNNYYKNV